MPARTGNGREVHAAWPVLDTGRAGRRIYVAEDHPPGGSDRLGGGEGDQSVAAPDVEHRLPGRKGGVGDDFVADRREGFQVLTEQFWVAAVAALKQPIRPLVVLRLRCHAFFPLPEPEQIPVQLGSLASLSEPKKFTQTSPASLGCACW